MKYQIPKIFMGKPVAGSLERVLAGLNTSPQNPPQTPPLVNAPNLQGYIYVPSINLHVAKQRTHTGLNWNQTHETLQGEGLRMPTIPQFLEYLKFLQNGYADRNEGQLILDDILKVGNWRGEWLDARFTNENNVLYSDYHHIFVNGELKPQVHESLRDHLKEDCWADIFGSANSQGLPTQKLGSSYEQGKNAYFWYPRENRVARFDAVSDWAGLSCDWDPAGTGPSLGVFACAEGATPKN
jgi:hypothetical protein